MAEDGEQGEESGCPYQQLPRDEDGDDVPCASCPFSPCLWCRGGLGAAFLLGLKVSVLLKIRSENPSPIIYCLFCQHPRPAGPSLQGGPLGRDARAGTRTPPSLGDLSWSVRWVLDTGFAPSLQRGAGFCLPRLLGARGANSKTRGRIYLLSPEATTARPEHHQEKRLIQFPVT